VSLISHKSCRLGTQPHLLHDLQNCEGKFPTPPSQCLTSPSTSFTASSTPLIHQLSHHTIHQAICLHHGPFSWSVCSYLCSSVASDAKQQLRHAIPNRASIVAIILVETVQDQHGRGRSRRYVRLNCILSTSPRTPT
jgi:hypothetical protein